MRASDQMRNRRLAADVTAQGIDLAIARMASDTASSPGDNVKPAALMHGGVALHKALALLSTAVLKTGTVISVWTIGYVGWLHKGGS